MAYIGNELPYHPGEALLLLHGVWRRVSVSVEITKMKRKMRLLVPRASQWNPSLPWHL